MINKEDGFKFYKQVQPYIDENGWINATESNGKSGFFMESDCDFNFPYLRLKSLKGIENNNGWIKIESEDDLPNESCKIWVKDKKSKEIFLIHFTSSFFTPISKSCTHWKPIKNPQLPLY